MEREFEGEDLEEDSTIYNEEVVEDLEENDEINPNEGAFMEGYVGEKKKSKKKKLKKKPKKGKF